MNLAFRTFSVFYSKYLFYSLGSLVVAIPVQYASAQERTLQGVTVETSRTSQLGIADSANTGIVTQQQLYARTAYRAGETLEAVPGLIVSQHSGEGKANQFYLRGFNLDHGTDLRTLVDGMLVNQRSHGHGQGCVNAARNFLKSAEVNFPTLGNGRSALH